MRRIEWANTLRGIAVIAVLVAHFGVGFWVDQSSLSHLARRPPLYEGRDGAPEWAVHISEWPIDLAAFGVALFFLLSGYVIALSMGRYTRAGFLIGRLTRILPTYAAGYLVTCFVILIASDPANELSMAGVLSGMVPGLSIVLGTAAPADGIVWTLIVELVFYLVCLVTYRHLTQKWQAIAAVTVACIAFQGLVEPPVVQSPLAGAVYVALLACPFLPIMLVGVVLHRYAGAGAHRVGQTVVPAALVLSYFWLASTTSVVPTSLSYRLTFAGTTLFFASAWLFARHWRGSRATGFMADISYPLYVVHPVLGYFLMSYLASRGIWPWVDVSLVFVAVTFVAWGLHALVEDPTHRAGKGWARRVSERNLTRATGLSVNPPGRRVG